MIDRSSRDSIGNFKSDGLMPPVLLQNNTKELNDFIDSEVEKGYERAYIFGNGKGLNNVTEEEISIINDNDKFVSIGINRTFWKFYTDYLLFADHNTLNVIMKHIFSLKRNCTSAKLPRSILIPASVNVTPDPDSFALRTIILSLILFKYKENEYTKKIINMIFFVSQELNRFCLGRRICRPSSAW